MEDALAVDVFDGPEKLIHVEFDFFVIKVFVLHQAFIHVLFHQLED